MGIFYSGLYLTTGYGGAEISSEYLISKITQNDYFTTVFTTKIGNNSIGDRIYKFPDIHLESAKIRGMKILDRLYENTFSKIAVELEPELIHSIDQSTLPSAFNFASSHNIPMIATIRDYAFVCQSLHCVKSENIGYVNKNKCFNNEYLNYCLKQEHPNTSQFPYRSYVKSFKTRTSLLRRELNEADALIAVSKFMKETLMQFGIAKEKIHVVYNSPVHKMYLSPSTSEEKIDYPVLVYAGHLHEFKGVIELVKAMKIITEEYGNTVLYIFGDGPVLPKIKTIIKKHNLGDNIKLMGFRSQKVIYQYLQIANLNIVPSKWAEPFSRNLVDSSFFSLPVVATRTGGSIEYGESGAAILCDPGDPQDLAIKVIEILDSDRVQQKLAKNAKQFYENNIDPNMMIEDHIRIYEGLID